MDDSTQFRTRWSLISMARKGGDQEREAARALEELTQRYRPSILAAIRRSGVPMDDSEDVCQDFLARIFVERAVPRADAEKGRFRTFLLHLLRQSIVDWQRKLLAQKRGAGQVINLEMQEESVQNQMVDFEIPSVELEFEIDFARQIHDDVLTVLRQHYAKRGQESAISLMEPFLLTKQEDGIYASLAESLGKPEVTVRQILSRLRQRYGQLLREHVLETINDEKDLYDELRHVIKLLLASQQRVK